jgi:hypothetical protein
MGFVMSVLKPVLILAILSTAMLYSNSLATTPPPRVGSTPDAPKTEEAKADVKAPAKPAQPTPKKPIKRRAVTQLIDPVPRVVSPTVYGPVLTTPHVGIQPLPSPLAPAPQVLNGCPGGACTDSTGARYTGGVGSVLISPEGRACSNNGITVQCF